MPYEMHVENEHHSITVHFKIEQTGTSETVLRFDVKKKYYKGKKFVILGNHL